MADESATDRDTIEQLADSFVLRFRAGERPSIEEYAGQYPELAAELRELLPALVLLEQNASPDDTAAFGGATTVAAPREIGDFAIVREIGRGGMGVVYEAVQQSLGRHVALKVLSSPGLLNPSHLERFRLEARAAARLHHTHIVPVFGVGEHGGLHYYAMQFIQGQSLDLVIDALRELRRSGRPQNTEPGGDTITRAVADGLLTGCFRADEPDAGCAGPVAGESPVRQIPATSTELRPASSTALSQTEFTSSHGGREFYRSVARVALQVAEALAYAHSEGILHRDIKPSNLLVDARGNVWITDFGLAKSEGTDGLTQTGDFVGTLRYMAPERLEGWSDRRSDLYSLGATLYELLTLRPFLESDSRGQLLDKILHENPSSPSKFDRLIPRDLETIVLKAIAKEPTARYRTADELAEDLRRFLADRPVLARRSTPSEQFARWCRRNPVVAGLLATVFTLLVGGIAVSSYFAASAAREAKLAVASRAHAESQGKRAESVSKFFMEDVVGLADPERYNRAGISLVEALDLAATSIEERFPNDPDLRADVRDQLGEIYCGIDRPQKAVEQLEQAVELRQTLFSDQDRRTLKSRGNLGYAQYLMGRFAEAGRTLKSVWQEQSKVLGPADPDTLETSTRFCITLMEIRQSLPESQRDGLDLQISESSYRAALARYGLRHSLTLDAESTYAWVLRWRGTPESNAQALDLSREAAIGLRELGGPEDVRAQFAAYGYAGSLSELGRHEEAAVEFKQVLEIRTRVLGWSHIDTMFTVWRLAAELRDSDKKAEAVAVLDAYYAHLDEALLTNSFRRGRPFYTMSAIYASLGRIDRAVELQNLVYRMFTDASVQQPDDSVYAEWIGELSEKMSQSAYPELRNGDRAVELATKACKLTNYQNPSWLAALGSGYAEKGDFDAATKWYDRALELNSASSSAHIIEPLSVCGAVTIKATAPFVQIWPRNSDQSPTNWPAIISPGPAPWVRRA